MNKPTSLEDLGRDIVPGLILIFASVASVVAALHHPVIKTSDRSDVFARIPETAFTDRLVHGVLIFCSIALLFALCRFAQRQSLQRATVLLGLIWYAFGTLAMIGAALVDGFVVPEIGMKYLGTSSNVADDGLALLRLCSIGIQLLTKFGIVAISIAILSWSAGMIRAGRGALVAALIGFGVVICELLALIYGGPNITAHTIVPIIAAMAAWYFVIGALLISKWYDSPASRL